tara:strand:- start:679 stop:1050 length:372 start_codon:yes stop_codon:yes gene_type:complete
MERLDGLKDLAWLQLKGGAISGNGTHAPEPMHLYLHDKGYVCNDNPTRDSAFRNNVWREVSANDRVPYTNITSAFRKDNKAGTPATDFPTWLEARGYTFKQVGKEIDFSLSDNAESEFFDQLE